MLAAWPLSAKGVRMAKFGDLAFVLGGLDEQN